MSKIINSFLRNTIIAGLALVSFVPLYVAGSFYFPFITGKAFAFRIIVEIVFALWLILVLREKGTNDANSETSVAPRINSVTVFVTAFTFIILLTDLFGLNPLRSIWSNFERMEGWMTIVHLWGYFIVLSSVLGVSISSHDGRRNWHRFINVVLVAGTVTALYGLFQFFGWADTHQSSTRVDASLGNSAYMAVYMIMNIFLAGYMAFTAYINKLAMKGSGGILVWVYAVLAAFLSFIMFQTATRGSILGWVASLLVVCAIYAVFGRKEKGQSDRSRVIAGGIIALTIILGLLFYLNKDAEWIKNNAVLGRLATISISDTKTQARGFIWPIAIKGVFESPKTAIFGVGQENFNYIFNKNYNPLMWRHEQWFDRAHSVFMDWLVAGGLVGLIVYLSLYVISLFYIVKSNLNIGQKAMLVGLLVGYGIHNIFVFDNQTSYVMFFTFLAFVHSFREGKVPKFLHETKTPVSEDYYTVRDYVFLPVIVILFVSCLYFINIRPIQSNTRLITAISACGDANRVSTKVFTDALGLDQTVANQEIREQLMSCAHNVISGGLPQQTKIGFYELAKKETESQITTTPDDARIYIISGSFFDSINDFTTAKPLLEKAMELSPTKQSIAVELASNYINLGQPKDAVTLMERVYKSALENFSAKNMYITSLITAGEDKKAIEIFGKDSEDFLDLRVINAYVVMKQYSKAIELYKKLLVKTPSDRNVYSALASVYVMNNEKIKAISVLKDAVVKFPELKMQVDGIIKQIQDGSLKIGQ